MNKKAVSPLIATLLLIFAAIVLGVLVMNWGRAHVEAGAKCSVATDMKLVDIGGVKQVCYSRVENGFVEFTVENGVNVDNQLQIGVNVQSGETTVYNVDWTL